MKKTMGILLMILGAVSFVVGLMMYRHGKREHTGEHTQQILTKAIESAAADGILTKKEKELIADTAKHLRKDPQAALKLAEEQTAKNAPNAEVAIIDIDKKNGLDFEKYVIKKFDSTYFTVLEWAGDKYVDGIYAEGNKNPDMIMEFRLKDVKRKFAVECKFRSNLYNGGVKFADNGQIERYKNFEKKHAIPVFIVIGVGGSGANPQKLFIHPLRFVHANFLPLTTLEKGEKMNLEKNFYFDEKQNLLR